MSFREVLRKSQKLNESTTVELTDFDDPKVLQKAIKGVRDILDDITYEGVKLDKLYDIIQEEAEYKLEIGEKVGYDEDEEQDIYREAQETYLGYNLDEEYFVIGIDGYEGSSEIALWASVRIENKKARIIKAFTKYGEHFYSNEVYDKIVKVHKLVDIRLD